jgi:dienelactone hydrolase
MGNPRAACIFRPVTTEARPLVIYLHGALGSANAVYNRTLLRQKAESFALSGDPTKVGFVLVSDQGRNMASDNGNPSGARRDLYFRNWSQHEDVAALDQRIDALVAEGKVDAKRIYLTGWSNGGFFAQAYGIERHERPTPGGNRVAAVAVFDAANPYEPGVEGEASCAYQPLPRSSVPIMIVHRACSIIGCDAVQRSAVSSPPGFDVASWIAALKTRVGATDVTQLTLNAQGAATVSCANICTRNAGIQQHVRWPDGIADGSGIDREIAMLSYLREHSLP